MYTFVYLNEFLYSPCMQEPVEWKTSASPELEWEGVVSHRVIPGNPTPVLSDSNKSS